MRRIDADLKPKFGFDLKIRSNQMLSAFYRFPALKSVYKLAANFYDATLVMNETLGEIVICPMTEADLDAVLEIEQASFPRPWTREHFSYEVHTPACFPMVAMVEGSLAGYICPMLVLDEGHILDVAVSPQMRGRGIGRLLVERALLDCRERGAAFVSLEVRRSNDSAISLYRAIGFAETGIRKRYYENGEDAVLMEYLYAHSEANDAV